MIANHSSGALFRPAAPFLLLAALMSVVWLAGGASRPDVLGQTVVRGAAWGVLAALALAGARPPLLRLARPVWLLAIAAATLTLLQLVPLPPTIWATLPGRALLMEAATASGQSQPWRPWSMVPEATFNALASLVVPFAVLTLVVSLTERERAWLPGLILSLIAASTVVGLLQMSGIGFNNLFVNDKLGDVSGPFANRNHFALFLAIGCLLAPVWAFLDGRQPGSRTGLLVGALGIALGLIMVWQGIRRALSRYPRWVFPALVAGIVAAIAIFVLISVAAGRAVSINRALTVDAGQDMRARGLPTVLEMIRTYFPFGSGLGGFDPIFRIHEPFELLALTYHVHAHNDFLEIALDAGLPGILLLGAAILWWAWASIGAWRAGSSPRYAIPKLGSAMLLLVFIASIFDFPARTPMIMAMIVVAGVWLCIPVEGRGGSALPKSGKAL